MAFFLESGSFVSEGYNLLLLLVAFLSNQCDWQLINLPIHRDQAFIHANGQNMSRAFVKESEGEWLGDVAPNISDLERFLTRESGERVFLVRTKGGPRPIRPIHEMSNGNSYALDFDGRWMSVG